MLECLLCVVFYLGMCFSGLVFARFSFVIAFSIYFIIDFTCLIWWLFWLLERLLLAFECLLLWFMLT